MATQPDPLIDWMVNELHGAGPEGIEILVVFDKLSSEIAGIDHVTMDRVWKGLVAREDTILVASDYQEQLKDSIYQAWNYQDLLLIEDFHQRISLGEVPEAAPANDVADQAHPSPLDNPDDSGSSQAKRKASEVPLPNCPAKRRGRPPKPKPTSSSDIPPQPKPPPKRRGRPPKSSYITSESTTSFNQDPSPAPSSSTSVPAAVISDPISTTRGPSTRKRTQTARAKDIDSVAEPSTTTAVTEQPSSQGLPVDDGPPAKKRKYTKAAAEPSGPATRIIVFKSDKLKDPEYLEKNKGSWKDVLAKSLAEQMAKVSQIEPKRRRGRPQKKKTLPADAAEKVNEEPVTEFTALSAAQSTLLISQSTPEPPVSTSAHIPSPPSHPSNESTEAAAEHPQTRILPPSRTYSHHSDAKPAPAPAVSGPRRETRILPPPRRTARPAVPSSGGLNPAIVANIQASLAKPSFPLAQLSLLNGRSRVAQMLSQSVPRISSYSSPYGPPQPLVIPPTAFSPDLSPDYHAGSSAPPAVASVGLPTVTPPPIEPPPILPPGSANNPLPKTTSTPSKRKFSGGQSRPAKRMRAVLAEELSEAEAVVFPDEVVKLACKYKDHYGNLVLLKDALEFHVAVVPALETPIVVLPILQILENPKQSAPGSKPMELRISAKDDLDADVTHHFAYADTPSSRDAAQKMWMGIVSAMVKIQFDSGGYRNADDVKREIEKPHVCPKCGDRFKNVGGLEYHLTKAQKSACNPNADPEVVAAKKARDEKKKMPKPPKEPKVRKPRAKRSEIPIAEEAQELEYSSEAEEPVAPKKPRKQAVRAPPKTQKAVPKVEKSAPVATDPYESDSSQDSLMEFLQTHSTTGVERPRLPSFGVRSSAPPKKKIYKSLPFEANVLAEIYEETFLQAPEDIDVSVVDADAEQPEDLPELDQRRCQQIILSLVEKNDHVFPGDRGIWIALVGIWLKQYPKKEAGDTLPGTKLCSQTIDHLVESKKLKLLEFTFADAKKRDYTRTILTTHGYRLTAKESQTIKESIKSHHPKYFVPVQFAPTESVLDKLTQVATRSLVNKERFRRADSVDVQSDSEDKLPIVVNDESSGDEFIGDAVEEEDDAADLDLEEEEDEPASDVEEVEEPKKKKAAKRTRRPKGAAPRKRDPAHNKAISDGLRRAWEKAKAEGKKFFPNRKPAAKPRARNFFTPEQKAARAAARVPLTQEEKDKRAANAALRLQTWNASPAYMPNPESGAWDQLPPPPKKPSRKGIPRKNRQFFVEPITYLQAPNGAWSQRAFGHGVKPIFARPSRRADGNPNFAAYQRRLDEGYRPVSFPASHRRVNLPAVPSKKLLQAAAEATSKARTFVVDGIEFNQKTGKPVRKQKQKDKRPSASSESETAQKLKPTRKYDPCFPRYVAPTDDEMYSMKISHEEDYDLDEIAIVNFVEPGKLGPLSPRNPGLEFLPPSFGLDPSKYSGLDPTLLGFLPIHTQHIQFIDTRIVAEDGNPAGGSWTVRELYAPVAPKFSIQWDDATAFDMETLPFDMLEGGSERLPMPKPQPRKRKQTENTPSDEPKEKKQKIVGNWPGRNVNTLPEAEIYRFSRVLTALPHDFRGVIPNVQDAPKVFGVELGKANQATAEGRRIKGPKAYMDPEKEQRFIITVVVVRTLTGGRDGLVDWVIVAHYFQEFTCNFLKTYWTKLLVREKEIIDILVAEFQQKFPPAYEAKKVPQIDYEHLFDYEWSKLVRWVKRNLTTWMVEKEEPELPATREEFEEEGNIIQGDRDKQRWREPWFKLGVNTANHHRITSSNAVAYTSSPRLGELQPDNEKYRVARSWLRATALTPEAVLQKPENLKIAETKLKSLGQETIDTVLCDLRDDKVFIQCSRKKPVLGRRYECMDTFFAPLRRAVKDPVFLQAVEFKQHMDMAFRAGEECIGADYFMNEGAVMVVTSMLAAGRIHLITVNEPMKKMGIIPGGGYETKTIPKSALIFDMDIYPSETYVYDDENPIFQDFLLAEPPRPDMHKGKNAGAIPLWFGIHDGFFPELWKKVLIGIGQLSGLRAGINIAALSRVMKPMMEQWELELLMEWGTEVGLFQKCAEGIEGWVAGEWWWLLIGATVQKYRPASGVDDLKLNDRGTTGKAPAPVKKAPSYRVGKKPVKVVNKVLERVRKMK